MVDWIRDVDTGELFPVESDFNFETPAHLEIPEYTIIDYDKTKQMTITELQNQLIAAQNHIEAIENEKTSDNNSIATVNDVSLEVVSKSGFKDFISEYYPIFILIGLCAVLVIFGFYAIKLGNDGNLNISYSSEQKSVYYEITPIPEIGSLPIYSSEQGIALYLTQKEQEQPQEQQGTEQDQSDTEVIPNGIDYLINKLLSVAAILIPVIGSLLVLRFFMNVLRNSM